MKAWGDGAWRSPGQRPWSLPPTTRISTIRRQEGQGHAQGQGKPGQGRAPAQPLAGAPGWEGAGG